MSRPMSSQARKQRKWVANAPLHTRRKMMAAALNKTLKERYKRNSLPVRKGDTVEVMRGSLKGRSGEVLRVDLSEYRLYVQGVTSKKTDGTEVERPIHPSNVRLTELNDEDKERRDVLSRNVEEE